MSTTAARPAEDPFASDGGSEDDVGESWAGHAGSLSLTEKTLKGIAATSAEAGEKGFGRHANTILLGRSVWASEPLSMAEQGNVQEHMFDDDAFPPLKTMEAVAKQAIKEEEARLMPFLDKTRPATVLRKENAAKALQSWLDKLAHDEEEPNEEQLEVLESIRDRILQELELDNETAYWRKFRRQKCDLKKEETCRGCDAAAACTAIQAQGKVASSRGFAGCLRRLWVGNMGRNLSAWLSRIALLTRWEVRLCIQLVKLQ